MEGVELLQQSMLRAKFCKKPTFPQPPVSIPIASPPPEGWEMRLLGLMERVAKLEFLNSIPETHQPPILAQPMPKMRRIITDVSFHFELTVDEILSDRRQIQVVLPRQIAMYLCKTMTTYALPSIGRYFNGRDHSTVLHSVRKIAALRKTDVRLDQDITTIERTIQNFQERDGRHGPAPVENTKNGGVA